MEQEQDTTTWVIVACGIYIYWLCCRRPCFTIHTSLDPHPCVSVSNCVACLNLHPPPPGSWRWGGSRASACRWSCCRAWRWSGSSWWLGLGRGWLSGSPDEDVARAGDGDPHPHHALPQLPGPAARRPAQLGPLLGHSPPTGQTPVANMVILIPSAGSGLG